MVFAAFGVTSGGLGAVSLAAYRVYLLPVSVLSIGVAFYLSYTKGMGGPKRRRYLWGALAVSLFFWSAPWLRLFV
ncbi:MAG: hypothetical protein IH788_04525 [Nitrospinae bacterium]|nr:hypothetical protein [Nitrospinota bacterium]MDV2479735.1 hypothetical protein [bacterium]